MHPEVLMFFQNGLILVVMLSAPPLITAVVVGILTSLIQSLFQLQDQALPFAFKLVAVGICLAMTGRWISLELIQLTERMLDSLVNITAV